MLVEKNKYLKCIAYEEVDIKKVISTIEEGGLRIALILSKENKLIGTVSDGDIRRGLLKGLSLQSPVRKIMQKDFFKANLKTTKNEISSIMKKFAISQIPIVSDENELVGLEISEDLLPTSTKYTIPNFALLMAGGRGSRLKPFTNDCPKPLLPINGQPMLEIILDQCINYGIRNFYISVCYLSEKIINYFGDGSKWGVDIQYVKENRPLGTAGALKIIPKILRDPLLVINGDVLTKTNLQDVLNYHSMNSGDITICAREHTLSSPYGVIEVEGICFKSIVEKQTSRQLVNAGIYVINPDILDLIKKDQYLDMPELICLSKNKNKNVIVYPVHEYWLDVGKPDSYNKASFEWQNLL